MSVTPDFIGQVYKDTNTGNIWRANSTTPGDWTLELQNMQMEWSPRTLKLGELMGYQADYDNPTTLIGITSIVFKQVSLVQNINIVYSDDILSIGFPNLTTDDAIITIANCANLSSITLPNLVTCISGISFRDLASLSTLALPSWVPTNGSEYKFHNNALDAASVNGLLARMVAEPTFVSGTVKLEGGTNAAPSGQGATDATTLLGRGVTLTTN